MESNLDLSKFWCWQKECPDYGKMDAGNIVLKERCGKDYRALLKCKTCGHCFSETHGTPFFGLHTPIDEVCRTLAQIPEKGSIRGAARSSGHDKGTICRWVDLAGKHCQEVTDYFLKELRFDRVQVDEIWSYIKKGEKRRCNRFERTG